MKDKTQELVDIDADIVVETKDAYCLSVEEDTFDAPEGIWLPKSQVENNGDGTFTMPRWLAEKKDLV